MATILALANEHKRIARTLDYYDRLQLEKSATPTQIKLAHRKLATQFHPDRCRYQGAPECMALINVAYSTLINQQARKLYDAARGYNQQCTLCGGSGVVKIARGFKVIEKPCKCKAKETT